MKYCQGPKCHTYTTKDRIRGSKGDKHYETRKRSSFYYLDGNVCSMQCQADWFDVYGSRALDHFGRITQPKVLTQDNAWSMICQDEWFKKFGNMALDHFGRIHEPKRQDASGAWYKDYAWRSNGHLHYFINDLLGERRPITEQQYRDDNLTTPTT